MSIKIEIHIPDSEASNPNALANRLAVLGYTRFHLEPVSACGDDPVSMTLGEAMALDTALRAEEAKQPNVLRDPAAAVYHEPAKEPAKRGRKKAEAVVPTPEQIAEHVAEARAVEAASEPTRAISATPENRIDPEVEAQDAADEAAEVAEAPAKELTAEDLRAVMGRYVTKFGIAEAQADGQKLFTDALGPPPAGSEMWSVSLASKSQDTLAKAIAAWTAAVEKGERYGRA